MQKLTLLSKGVILVALILISVIFTRPNAGSASQKETSSGGNILVFTDDVGRLVIAIDALDQQGRTDGIVDRYYWYKWSQAFTKKFEIKLTGANVVDRGRTIELSAQGIQLLFSVDPDPSKTQTELMTQDGQLLDKAASQLISPQAQTGATEYKLSGGYEIGRATPTTQIALSSDSFMQSNEAIARPNNLPPPPRTARLAVPDRLAVRSADVLFPARPDITLAVAMGFYLIPACA